MSNITPSGDAAQPIPLLGCVIFTIATKENTLVVSIFHATIDIAFFAAATNLVITNGLGFLITLWGVMVIGRYYFPRKTTAAGRAKANAQG
jgi:hypothetical protein